MFNANILKYLLRYKKRVPSKAPDFHIITKNEIVAYRQECKVDIVHFADKFHVIKQAGITSVVDCFSGDCHQKSDWWTGVAGGIFAVAAAVVSNGQFDPSEFKDQQRAMDITEITDSL